MLNIGSWELLVIAMVALIFIGPERLPELIRGVARLVNSLQSYWQQLYLEFKQGTGLDELRQDIHNETIMGKRKSSAARSRTSKK